MKKSLNKYYFDKEVCFLEITRTNLETHTFFFDKKFYEQVSSHHWGYSTGYACSEIDNKYIGLHVFLIKISNNFIEGNFVDHIDGNTKNNLLSNLRICTHQENCRNTHKRPMPNHLGGNKIIGVRKDPRCANSWRAQIYYDKKKHKEKTFRDEKEAIIQRLKWEKEFFGEFAPQRFLFPLYNI